MPSRATANLRIQLTANTSKFNRGMKEAGNRVGRFRNRIGKASSGLKGLTALFAGFLSVRGFKQFMQTQFEAIDALAKTSDRLGITTQALAGLEHGAAQSGVEISSLRRGLEFMQDQISEAARGVGTGKVAFDKLGLSAANLAQLQPEQQFAAIADALKSITNQTERVNIVRDIFGRGGTELLTLLDEGSTGLRQFAQEAEQLGIAISRTDAAKVEAANDAIDKMKKAFTGLGTQLAVEFADDVESVANAIRNFITEGNDGLSKMQKVLISLETAFQNIRIGVLQTARAINAAIGAGVKLAGGDTAPYEARRDEFKAEIADARARKDVLAGRLSGGGGGPIASGLGDRIRSALNPGTPAAAPAAIAAPASSGPAAKMEAAIKARDQRVAANQERMTALLQRIADNTATGAPAVAQ